MEEKRGKLHCTINKLKFYKLYLGLGNGYLYSLWTPDLSMCIGTTEDCSLRDLKWLANQITYFIDGENVYYIDKDLYFHADEYLDNGNKTLYLLMKFNFLYNIEKEFYDDDNMKENIIIESEIDLTDALVKLIERGDLV